MMLSWSLSNRPRAFVLIGERLKDFHKAYLTGGADPERIAVAGSLKEAPAGAIGLGAGSAPIGPSVVCLVHELDQQVGLHAFRGPTSVLIHSEHAAPSRAATNRMGKSSPPSCFQFVSSPVGIFATSSRRAARTGLPG
jgi:hypothetical protein